MSEDYSAQQLPTLMWNPARSVWEILGTESLLCAHLEPFSQTWPISGMMRNGRVYELPTQAHRTADLESSSLPFLPTPVASEGRKATAAQGSEEKSKTGQIWLTNIAHDFATAAGLPTPARQLLPTTRTSMKNGASAKEVAEGNPKVRLEAVTDWGKFSAAIRRWEKILGRPAPEPTKPDGKDGTHRLSSRFTEWMMGVPEGWITDCGLSRNDELKACGNGVVPQQAELALRILMEEKL